MERREGIRLGGSDTNSSGVSRGVLASEESNESSDAGLPRGWSDASSSGVFGSPPSGRPPNISSFGDGRNENDERKLGLQGRSLAGCRLRGIGGKPHGIDV